MNIGRKLLTDSDFASLWAILYQELYSLSTTNSCDTTLVYNTIYVICTSNSLLEEKLYWKIGDFLYNRCRHHKSEVLSAGDYIAEYILRFEDYNTLVTSINKLGCFLNESVKGRRLNDFGYLLWERVVIQNLKDEFFADVFDYPGDERMRVIESFEKVVPDPAMKLLYYTEKYEKIAIEKLRNRYKTGEITDLFEFSEYVCKVARSEEENMRTRFLESSYPKVRSALEEALFGEKHHELILNLADFLKMANASVVFSTVKVCSKLHHLDRSAVKNATVESKVARSVGSSFGTGFEPSTGCLKECYQNDFETQDILLESRDIKYESLTPDKIERLKLFIDEEFANNRALSQVGPLISRGSPRFFGAAALDKGPKYHTLLCQLGVLDTGFSILKRAYALYVDSIVKAHTEVLGSSISDVYSLVESLSLFNCGDFTQILFSIMKYYLQRTKPCFMNRLCEFTNLMSGDSFNQISASDLKPFSRDELSKTFCVLINMVSDKREFLSMYQNTLKDRILNRRSDLNWELRILSMLDIPSDDRSVKMVHEANSCNGHLKLLNGSYWSIDPENPFFRLPCELQREIMRENPSVLIYESDGKEVDCSELSAPLSPSNGRLGTSGDLKFKLLSDEGKDKIVSIAHQYSRITLMINSKVVAMNIYQYSVVDMLKKEPDTVPGISTKLRLPESLVKGMMASLLKSGIVSLRKSEYFLDCRNVSDCDISAVETDSEQALDVCIDSYLQSLCVSKLKRHGKMKIGDLEDEVRLVSRLEVEELKVSDAVEKIIEKGLAEARGDSVEFVL